MRWRVLRLTARRARRRRSSGGHLHQRPVGAESDINAALATLSVVSGNNAGSTATVSLTALPTASGYVYQPTNQHFYRSVNYGFTWANADTAARALTFNGQSGYLATIPNASVNAMLQTRMTGGPYLWTAGLAYDTGSARTWKWATGSGQSPIAGTTISNCSSNGFRDGPQNPRTKRRDGVQRSWQVAILCRAGEALFWSIARGRYRQQCR